MSKKWLVFFSICLLFPTLILIYWGIHRKSGESLVSPLQNLITPTQKPLDRFTFLSLATTTPEIQPITIQGDVFTYTSDGKRITGQIKTPKEATPSAGFPVILMIRGYVDPEIYQTGMGTKNAAEYFSTHGFVTIAPDFLGYGGSDVPDTNTLAARLHHPLDVINLLASLSTLPNVDTTNINIWGHSNGGQIALSVLEITNRAYPTVLWAPVSKPFPYSILYYTDESEDRGKALRQVIAGFEKEYDVDNYSIDRYYDRVAAPLQIHQGTADDAVPLKWSNDLVKTLKDLGKDITYFTYEGSDHNLRPAWNTVVARDLEFFNLHRK